MKRSNSTNADQRKEILAELDDITTMERSTLVEKYRERPAPYGQGTVRLGPHFDAAWKARLPILANQRAKARRWSHQENKKIA